MPKSFSVELLLTLLFLSSSLHALDIYIDSSSTSSNPAGTESNPFQTLTEAYILMVQNPSYEKYSLFLKPNSIPYTGIISLMNLTQTSFTMSSWGGPIIVENSSDCQNLPIITLSDTTQFYFESIYQVNISGINLVNPAAVMLIDTVTNTYLSNMCVSLDTGNHSAALEIINSPNLTVHNLVATIPSGQNILTYSNSEPSEILSNIQVINITITVSPPTGEYNLGIPSFDFFSQTISNQSSYDTSNSAQAAPGSGILLQNVKINPGQENMSMPLLFDISGLSDVTILGVFIENQSFSLIYLGIFQVYEAEIVSIVSAAFTSNSIYTQLWDTEVSILAFSAFFNIYETGTLALVDTIFTNNTILSQDNAYVALRVVSVDGIMYNYLQDAVIFENNFFTDFALTYLNTTVDDPSTGMNVSNINLQNNTNLDNTTFYIVMFSESPIWSLYISNINFVNNSLAGRLFDLVTVGQIDTDVNGQLQTIPTTTCLNITNVTITNNPNSVDFGFLFFYAVNPPFIEPDYITPVEYYSIAFRELTVTNNNFSKGTATDSVDQACLFEASGSQIYMEGAVIVGNTFNYYNFVSLEQQVSSVFLINSTVENITFNNGNLLITTYENLVIPRGPYDNSSNTVQAFYRYAFVVGSNFSEISFMNSTLFTLNNAFLQMSYNTFGNLSFNNSQLFSGGVFRPPSLNLNFYTVERNIQVEQASLIVQPYLLEIYKETQANIIPLEPPVVYFYVIEYNPFANFTSQTQVLFEFEDYQCQQSIVSIKYNTFYNFTLLEGPTNIIQLQKSNAFRFFNNSVTYLTGAGTVLSFSQIQNNKLFFITNNVLENFIGPSFLLVSGTDIPNTNFSSNLIQNNLFTSTLVSINIDYTSGQITWANNTCYNNTLMSQDNSLYSIISFISFSVEYAETGQSMVFDGWNFTNNSFINLQSFSQYGELNALFSLLLANSTVSLQNSYFTNLNQVSQGVSMFYIFSKDTIIQNCTFSSNTVAQGISVFNFKSRYTMLESNIFQNINVLNGKGLFYLNSQPYLVGQIELNMVNNSFTNCQSGFGNVLAVEDSILTLGAVNNYFFDSFNGTPAIAFSSSTCYACYMLESTFEVTSDGVAENMFYDFDGLDGNIEIEDPIIMYSKADLDIDVFLTVTDSPTASITIANMTWVEGSKKNSFRLASIDSGNLTIMDTEFDGFYYNMRKTGGYVIQVNAASRNLINAALNLVNLKFRNMTFQVAYATSDFKAGAIAFITSGNTMSYYWKLNVINCTFNSISMVSAVYIQMPSLYDIQIMNSIFRNITNQYAPALNYFTISNSQSQIYIYNNVFDGNIATKAGGAISLSALNYTLVNNSFTNNCAEFLGGAILLTYTIRQPGILQNNYFYNNTADVGNDVGSSLSSLTLHYVLPPDSLMYIDDPSTSNQTNLRSAPITIKNASSSYIPSISLNATFLDRDGNPTIDFGSSNPYLILSFGNQSTVTSFNCTWYGCYINQFNVTISGQANTIIPVQVYYYSTSSTSSQGGLLRYFNIQLRACKEGEYNNTHTGTCDYCKAGSYSLSPTESCQDCPSEVATCPGGNVLIAKAGQWRASQASATFYECRNDGIQRCVGGIANDGCLAGYTGPLCEACDFDDGYVESGTLRCGECDNVWMSFAINIGATILYLLYKIFCICRMYYSNEIFCSNTTDNFLSFKASESNYYVRLLIVYSQVISIVYFFNTDLREYLGAVSQVGNPSAFILVGLECSLKAIGVTPDKFIYVSTACLLISPFLECLVIIGLARLIARKFLPPTKLSQFARLTVLYMILLVQPGMVGFLTSFLSCSDVYATSNVEYIALHPNWTCVEPLYSFYKYFLVIPFMVFWAVLIPIYIFFTLFRNRKVLNELNVRMTLGALYNINKPRYYYWGTVVMVLELILSYTTYAFQDELKVRVFTLFILLWSYQFAVRQLKPYRFSKFNSMESLAFSLLMLNIILGYYTVDNPSVALTYSAYFILGVLNIAMILFLAWKMFDMTVMRIFDLFLDKVYYWMRRERQPKDSARDRLTSVQSSVSCELKSFDTEERKDSPELRDRLNTLARRPSFEPARPDESFVM